MDQTGQTNGILVGKGSSPVISNCTVSGCNDDGIEVDGGKPIIRNTTIKYNGWGIMALYGSKVTVIDSIVMRSEENGITLQGADANLTRCRIIHNKGWGVDGKQAGLQMTDTEIAKNENGVRLEDNYRFVDWPFW